MKTGRAFFWKGWAFLLVMEALYITYGLLPNRDAEIFFWLSLVAAVVAWVKLSGGWE